MRHISWMSTKYTNTDTHVHVFPHFCKVHSLLRVDGVKQPLIVVQSYIMGYEMFFQMVSWPYHHHLMHSLHLFCCQFHDLNIAIVYNIFNPNNLQYNIEIKYLLLMLKKYTKEMEGLCTPRRQSHSRRYGIALTPTSKGRRLICWSGTPMPIAATTLQEWCKISIM